MYTVQWVCIVFVSSKIYIYYMVYSIYNVNNVKRKHFKLELGLQVYLLVSQIHVGETNSTVMKLAGADGNSLRCLFAWPFILHFGFKLSIFNQTIHNIHDRYLPITSASSAKSAESANRKRFVKTISIR